MDIRELLGAAIEQMAGCNDEKTVPSEADAASFVPIEDLRPGEILFQKEYGVYTWPGKCRACVVHRVLEPRDAEEAGLSFRWDFTTIFMCQGEIREISLDSRYFERMTEDGE
jgi:hypothetical protein